MAGGIARPARLLYPRVGGWGREVFGRRDGTLDCARLSVVSPQKRWRSHLLFEVRPHARRTSGRLRDVFERPQFRLQFANTIVPGVVFIPLGVGQGNKGRQVQSLKLLLEELNEFGANFFEVFHWHWPVDEAALFRWQNGLPGLAGLISGGKADLYG